MAQVTSNTQIDTINILNEAATFNDGDFILLQRGNTSFKLKKQTLLSQLEQPPISNNTLLGNISGSSSNPSEVTIDRTSLTNNTTRIPSSKAVRDYITSVSSNTNKKTKITSSQFIIPAYTQYTTLSQYSFENETFFAGNVLILFSMSNKHKWGGRDYRILFNGNTIAERRYEYIPSAFESDWSFDIKIPLTIPSTGIHNLLVQCKGVQHQVDIGCGIIIMDF